MIDGPKRRKNREREKDATAIRTPRWREAIVWIVAETASAHGAGHRDSILNMSILGAWDITITTPFGAQVVNLEFTDEDTGVALHNVAISGSRATCSVAITEPMSVTLKCSVEIDEDALTGTASAGFFGRFALTGVRTSG
jgi:hypothetical protein